VRGLLGVRLPMIELEPDEDDLEIVVTLNGLDLRRVASGEFLLDPTRAEWPEPQPNESGLEAYREPCLSFRIYVYPDAGNERIPHCPQPCGELVAS
jgi:hypothetical protein